MNNFDNEEDNNNQNGFVKKIANGTKNVVVGTVGAVGNSIWWAGSGIISIGGNVLGVGQGKKTEQKKKEIDELTGQQLVNIKNE